MISHCSGVTYLSPYVLHCSGVTHLSPYVLHCSGVTHLSPYVLHCSGVTYLSPYVLHCSEVTHLSPYVLHCSGSSSSCTRCRSIVCSSSLHCRSWSRKVCSSEWSSWLLRASSESLVAFICSRHVRQTRRRPESLKITCNDQGQGHSGCHQVAPLC